MKFYKNVPAVMWVHTNVAFHFIPGDARIAIFLTVLGIPWRWETYSIRLTQSNTPIRIGDTAVFHKDPFTGKWTFLSVGRSLQAKCICNRSARMHSHTLQADWFKTPYKSIDKP